MSGKRKRDLAIDPVFCVAVVLDLLSEDYQSTHLSNSGSG